MESGRAVRATSDSYADQVKKTLMDAIASGALAAGTVYSVQTLAGQMGVSRTPVREALLGLQQIGLVRMVRNQGALIVGLTIEELREVFQIRLWLEVPAIREAVNGADDADRRRLAESFARLLAAAEAGDRAAVAQEDRAFHALILNLSGNQRLAAMIDDLRDLLISHGYASARHDRSLEDIARQHEPILDAVCAGDTDRAAAAMADHLTRTGAATIEDALRREGAAAVSI